MKKSKLLIPLLTISGAAAIVAPIMTSCSQGEVEEKHFTFSTGEKHIQPVETVGYIRYTFVATQSFTEEQAKLVQFTAICKTVPSGMSLTRCFIQSISGDHKLFTVQIDYSIDPSCFTTEGTKLEYDIKAHNGSWYQLETDFSITAKEQAH